MTVVISGTTGITNDGGYTGDGVVFADTTPANTLVTTTGGNVGVGTSSPVAKVHVVSTGAYNGSLNAKTGLHLQATNITGGFAASRIQWSFDPAAPKAYIEAGTYGADYLAFSGDGSSEDARIDSSGNLLVGTTSGSERIQVVGTSNNFTLRTVAANTSGTYYHIAFTAGVAGPQVGTISSNTTTTTYATSSDYRLKNTIAPMTGALDVVAQLKPVTYKWNVDGSDGQGFIAHELQEVVPDCVTGEKDAVDADGNPLYQGIDTSFLVATLTAALQEAHGLIKDLQSRVDALEAK